MIYDWNTYLLNGYGERSHVDTTLRVDASMVQVLLEAMRAHDLLDEVTPQPVFPPDGTQDAWDRLRETCSPDLFRIPAFKFTSPECWHITWQECYLLAHRLRGVQELKRLVDFAAEAVNKDGFCVC